MVEEYQHRYCQSLVQVAQVVAAVYGLPSPFLYLPLFRLLLVLAVAQGLVRLSRKAGLAVRRRSARCRLLFLRRLFKLAVVVAVALGLIQVVIRFQMV